MTRRSDVLELAVLGLLHDSPMHGYEIRKLLNSRLGVFAALSYGTLYPSLKSLLAQGWIREAGTDAAAGPLSSKRAKVVYEITAEGKDHFNALVADSGPASWEDDNFDVRFSLFARTDAATRLRVLEGRRMRLHERREAARVAMARSRERRDNYTVTLQQYGLDSVEREVRWLEELIDRERASNMTHSIDPDKPRTAPHTGAQQAGAAGSSNATPDGSPGSA